MMLETIVILGMLAKDPSMTNGLVKQPEVVSRIRNDIGETNAKPLGYSFQGTYDVDGDGRKDILVKALYNSQKQLSMIRVIDDGASPGISTLLVVGDKTYDSNNGNEIKSIDVCTAKDRDAYEKIIRMNNPTILLRYVKSSTNIGQYFDRMTDFMGTYREAIKKGINTNEWNKALRDAKQGAVTWKEESK